MHPAGIKFGLSQGLLALSGADVVLSPALLEAISEIARKKVQRRKRVVWIWDEAVNGAIQKFLFVIPAPRQEYVPFFMGLDRIVFETMGPIAQKAQIATRYGRHFYADPLFYRKFRRDVRRPHMRLEETLSWRLHFRETYAVIKALLAEHSPENMRHAELLTLCQIDSWDHSPNKLTIEDFLR